MDNHEQIPEINIIPTRIVQYKTVLAVAFSAAEGMDSLSQIVKKYYKISCNRKIYQFRSAMKQSLKLDDQVYVFAGYVALYSEADSDSDEDINVMKQAMSYNHFYL